MWRHFASYFVAWRSREGDLQWGWIHGLMAVYLMTVSLTKLTPRTHIGEGFVPSHDWFLSLLCLAVITFMMPVNNRLLIEPRFWRWSVLIGLFIPFVPLSLRVGIGLAVLAGVFCWFRRDFTQRIGNLWAGLCLLWLIMLGIKNAYTHIDARLVEFRPLAILLNAILRSLGQEAVARDGMVYISLEGYTQVCLPSFDKFGDEFTALLLAGLIATAWLYGWALKWIALMVGLTLSYALLYSMWLMSRMSIEPSVRWWDEGFVSIAFLPLVFLIGLIGAQIPRHFNSRSNPLTASLTGFFRKQWFLATVSGFCLLLGWFWVDPGIPKQGVVLIDERYSRWEWSEEPITTELFGTKTVYNYYNMVEALGHYFPTQRNFQEITDEVLANVSVLVLKTPTEAYPESVRQAIWRFVERGSGLWLIGDHTNAFGMNTYLNSVVSRYGLRFYNDSVMDPETGRNLWAPTVTSHPIVRRLPIFLFYTGCSLQSPWLAQDPILIGRVYLDRLDYSKPTFFGDFEPTLSERAGYVIQMAVFYHGAGRVALWSDSTLFSNFAIFIPGKMELVVATVDWLNRQNSKWILLRPLLLAIGIVFSLLSLRPALTGIPWLGILIGMNLALLASIKLNDHFYPPIKEYEPFEWIAF